MSLLLFFTFCLLPFASFSQTGTIEGYISAEGPGEEGSELSGAPLQYARITIDVLKIGAVSDHKGFFRIEKIPFGEYEISVKLLGYEELNHKQLLHADKPFASFDFSLAKIETQLNEVVISGTMQEVSKLESPVPVEVYSFEFFEANPAPSVFEALQNVNGVRPQLNCNVCNTGDIHINGLEGPYTMVLIDGMPIVSGLSTVYGLTGIPQSLIDRMEVVKGPASTLYGSEAVGGLINIITKHPKQAALLSADVMATSWAEVNADLGLKFSLGKKASSLLGLNYFNYQLPIDNNGDGFTDVTLQHRISAFSKTDFERKKNRRFSLAGRYVYEDRWGGDMNWTPEFRGGDSIYGESIYTNRWELFGLYQLPVPGQVDFQFSANGHRQNSVYGNTDYQAKQDVMFGQMLWNKNLGDRNQLLAGMALRYTYYDDNTPATEAAASRILLPGMFVQNETEISPQNKLLLGLRYDYNSLHGSIFSPRFNYKWNSRDRQTVLRLSAGNGYRVANVFTEDHAALTGARQVVFEEELRPERSWNANINFTQNIITRNKTFIGLDATAFYTWFNNRIIADYESDPNKIIYGNLDGFAVSKGLSLNGNVVFENGLNIKAGATLMDVSFEENGERQRQLLTEQFSAVWTVSYNLLGVEMDYTGNLYGPMELPLLGELDPRPGMSPWWSIQNIKLSKRVGEQLEIYGGVKNLLNYTPPANSIARAFDPFDKEVLFGVDGQALPTPNNPHALTFDPTYVFAPNQGLRGFLGLKVRIK
ncbi:MAG: TonB-dependent receptor plug domain-containing protein [Bacteroidia bacterium]